MERDWKNLPKHLLDSVAEKLLKPLDYLGFSLVCKSWYSVAKDNKSKHERMTGPMLLFYSGRKHYWNFYDVINKKVLKFQAKVPWKPLVGSSKGWLVFVHRNTEDSKVCWTRRFSRFSCYQEIYL
ncbi:putative F-box domain-containing protein [Rosa chinensis]|uniref:Putative F-box domain-containing protein n=1 Tax=Rosa chinensis TaxID=74649 RepID=A0A2P6RP97_ROSCH|nr:putative F-box domain-containing protein [Rosa chinensis]